MEVLTYALIGGFLFTFLLLLLVYAFSFNKRYRLAGLKHIPNIPKSYGGKNITLLPVLGLSALGVHSLPINWDDSLKDPITGIIVMLAIGFLYISTRGLKLK